MTTCFEKSCSVSSLRVSFLNVYLSFGVLSIFGLEGGMYNLIVLIPDHCILFTLLDT